jgi:hypothetical protein
MRQTVNTLVTWAALFGLYLLFVGQAARVEVLAGISAAALVVAGHEHTRSVAHRKLHVVAPWGWLAVRLGIALARDTGLVSQGLLRVVGGAKSRGRMMIQPYDPGGYTPQAAARRGIGILAASLAPNGYVLEVRKPSAGILMHRLVPEPPAADRQWPA